MANIKLKEINISVSFLREGKRYVAYSPTLDLSTSGKSYKEVKKRFEEIVGIFFEEIINKETFDYVLKELGWRKIKSKFLPLVVISQESHSFRLPVRV